MSDENAQLLEDASWKLMLAARQFRKGDLATAERLASDGVMLAGIVLGDHGPFAAKGTER